MQLNGLGQYQANALTKPWVNAAAKGTAAKGKDLALAGNTSSALAASKTNKVDATAPDSLHNGELAKVDSIGDEIQVSPTANTRAEVSASNTTSQTGQAAVTTANTVNDSLGKTEDILKSMKAIVTELADSATTAERRTELSSQFGQLADALDTVASTEVFAGHKTLDGKFRATFTVGDDTKVTIDATLPNGKAFTAEGLGLREVAGFLASNLARVTPEPGHSAAKGIDIASGAVSQVRHGLNEAASYALQAMTASAPLVSAQTGGTRQMALNLVRAASDNVVNFAAQAFSAQANVATSSALRLLV